MKTMSQQIISICNHKGGVGKTVTTSCLGSALAAMGKKTLLVDFDPQGNLTKGLGQRDASETRSIRDLISDSLNDTMRQWSEYIVPVAQNEDLISANISFAGMELMLSTVMSRETVFKRALEPFRSHYEYILIDSSPALNLLTVNAMAAADRIIIPVQAEPYATDGLDDLLHTIASAKKQLNPSLAIDGILITMTDARTNLSRHISENIREMFQGKQKVYSTEIPRCVKTAEASLYNKSPMEYAPNSESSKAYRILAKEVIENGQKAIATPTGMGRDQRAFFNTSRAR